MSASPQWQPLSANNEAANEAQSVLSAAEFFLDAFGVGGMSFGDYRSESGTIDFCDRVNDPCRVMRVKWEVCCEQHPCNINSVEFIRI